MRRTLPRSPVRDESFIAALERGFHVRSACASVGYARCSVYHWRNTDAAFAERWARACAAAHDRAELNRAGECEGYDRPVFAAAPGSARRFSDGQLMARLKALGAKYRDRATGFVSASQARKTSPTPVTGVQNRPGHDGHDPATGIVHPMHERKRPPTPVTRVQNSPGRNGHDPAIGFVSPNDERNRPPTPVTRVQSDAQRKGGPTPCHLCATRCEPEVQARTPALPGSMPSWETSCGTARRDPEQVGPRN
jgi:hypothetical protein